MSFGESLTAIMIDKNVTTQMLAKHLGVAPESVNRWKNNSRDIRLSNLVAVCRYFDCGVDYLVGRSEINHKPNNKTLPRFSDSVRKVMERNGISQYRLRKETRFSGGHFNDWDNGAEPQLSTIIELANYFDCSLDELVGLE